MISTPAEALYPNVQIHLVLGVGGGVGAGMISTPAEALSPKVGGGVTHPLKLYPQMCKLIWFWAGVSVLRVARGSTSSVPKRLVRFPAFRSDFVSAF